MESMRSSRSTLRDALSEHPPPGPAPHESGRADDDCANGLGSGRSDSARDAQGQLRLQSSPEQLSAGLELCGLTTVMVRGVCPKLSQQRVKSFLDEDGFAGQYDFLYVPVREKGSNNTGQAFVNFVSPTQARAFFDRYNGQSAKFARHDRVLSVLPASRQGYEANVNYFREKSSTTSPLFAHTQDCEQPSSTEL
eukprot:TRINITY_DN17732_c0_g4_i1.p1 TRINITY_DN17732_c0_g4~~TRINITY_DN17732_c0_g4_i1.p1  ORF type:complete len:194 (-),score=15.92 TRINITY_DN17732_c0_g4_i1:230-811(-)